MEMSRILVCDDDKEIVEAIEIYLTQEGYEISKAYDGEEALQKLKEEKNRPSCDWRYDAEAGRYSRNSENSGKE